MRLGAILIAVGFILFFIGVSVTVTAEENRKFEEWSSYKAENNCKLTVSYVGVLSNWTCDNGSVHWRVGNE